MVEIEGVWVPNWFPTQICSEYVHIIKNDPFLINHSLKNIFSSKIPDKHQYSKRYWHPTVYITQNLNV